jgi:hypothetical protein
LSVAAYPDTRCLLESREYALSVSDARMLEEAGQVGGFRSIIQYVSAKSLRAANHGHGGGEDNLGHWNSQAGQDRTIALLTDYKPGFFIDLAANEPILLSNTRALERDYGWRGICIDGNQKMLEKLVAARTCTVVRGIVTSKSGDVVEFLKPINDGKVDQRDGLAGILGNSTDNKKVKKGWFVVHETTVTLVDVLRHLDAPPEIDYLSLDIEGSEDGAMLPHDFNRYRFKFLTIERPSAVLRELLHSRGYGYLVDHACFGDQLWAHNSCLETAAAKLNLTLTTRACRRAGTPVLLNGQWATCHNSVPHWCASGLRVKQKPFGYDDASSLFSVA